jgi:16S rRNA (adenine1518-N6/adenine1519-N6)-dimethyltransferase
MVRTLLAMEEATPKQPSLRRLRSFGVRPDHELGQNFLIDSNILGVIARAAQLGPEDVVLEIGGGLGVLSERLAAEVAHVHVIELDLRLREALLDATGALEQVTVHWGDAMTLELAELSPAPAKVVSNLPYGIAAGVILRTIEELPTVRLWVAMVQREVGERLAASPGGGEYGLSSVLAQLACEVRVLRHISRNVFHPQPNVDSVLLELRRTGPAPEPAVRAFVKACFAHRRKTLVRSLALAGAAGAPPGAKGPGVERAKAALAELSLPSDVRAERLSPPQFAALAELLGL